MMTRILVILAVVLAVLSSAPQAQELDYGSEIREIDRQIAEAEEEAAKYSGGLILSMIKLRIESLRYSKAMIEHSRRQVGSDGRGFLSRFWGGRTSEAAQTPAEIGLICGHADYGTTIIVRPTERKAAISEASLTEYSETGDEIVLTAEGKGQTLQCHLNRYTLALRCPSQSTSEKSWQQQCKLAGPTKIPDLGRFWLRCAIPGKPDADQSFKLSINEDSFVKGGYVVWKDNGRECTLNRYSGRIFCDPRPSDWDVLDKPTCQVLPRNF